MIGRETPIGRTTAPELEATLGAGLRQARIDAGLTQAELAQRADVGLTTVHSLENGKGGTVSSLVKVLRALGRTDWLETLAPPIAFSPLQLYRTRQASKVRQRVRSR